MTTKQKFLSPLTAIGLMAGIAQALPLQFSENFNTLPAGDLDDTAWTASNWNVVEGSLNDPSSGNRVQSTNEGYASIALGNTFTEGDVWFRLDYRSSGQTSAGPFFSAGLTNGLVENDSGRNNSVAMISRGSNGDSTGFRARVAGSVFTSSSSRDEVNVGQHNLETVYTLVMRASKSDPAGNFDTGTFWLNPDLSGGVTSLTGGVTAEFDTGIDGISHIWIDDNGDDRRFEVDNIAVYAIPEPGTLMMGLAGGALLLKLIRRLK